LITGCHDCLQHRSDTILNAFIEARDRIIDNDNGTISISNVNLYHLNEVNKCDGSLLTLTQTSRRLPISHHPITVTINFKTQFVAPK